MSDGKVLRYTGAVSDPLAVQGVSYFCATVRSDEADSLNIIYPRTDGHGKFGAGMEVHLREYTDELVTDVVVPRFILFSDRVDTVGEAVVLSRQIAENMLREPEDTDEDDDSADTDADD